MSEIPLFLVSHLKTNRTLNDMAKVQIKSEKTTLFKRIFSIIELFDAQFFKTYGYFVFLYLRGLKNEYSSVGC